MITRKIVFDVCFADSFHVTYDIYGLMPVIDAPDGNHEDELISIEFDWDGESDSLKEAEKALDKHIKERHLKNKEYRIYYWWWQD